MDIIEVKKKIENLKNTDAYYGDDSIKKTIAELLEYIFDNTSQNSMEDSNSKISEQEKQEIVTLINSKMKSKVVLSGSNKTAVLVKNSNPEKTVLLKNVSWSGRLKDDSRFFQANIRYLGDSEYTSISLNNRNSGTRDFEMNVLKGKDIIIECPDEFVWEEGEEVIVLVEFEIL